MGSKKFRENTRPICIYCGLRPADSADHIFPQFLGGKTEIPACRKCNSHFGYTFESAVSSSLAPLTVQLAHMGIKPVKTVVWKRAMQTPEGPWIDISSDGKATLSTPLIEKGDSGKIKRAHYRTQKEVNHF